MSNWESLEELQEIIELGYKNLGYELCGDLGYRFLSSLESTFWSDQLIMSINPAGNRPDYESDSVFKAHEDSADVTERWMSAPMGSKKLRVQYQEIFKLLNWNTHTVLQAPFSPYRHPNWSKMDKGLRTRTEEFCCSEI